jgi:hypothetical protein
VSIVQLVSSDSDGKCSLQAVAERAFAGSMCTPIARRMRSPVVLAAEPCQTSPFTLENSSSRFRLGMRRLRPLYYPWRGCCFRIHASFVRPGIVAVIIALVALNLHFVSDVVAGSFVGISAAFFTVALWKAVDLITRGGLTSSGRLT